MTNDNRRALSVLYIGHLSLWHDRGDSILFRTRAREMKRQGIDCHILCLEGPQPPQGADLSETRVPIIAKRFLRQLTWNIFGLISALAMVRRHKIDVIYSLPIKGAVLDWLASRLTGKPLVVEINGLPTEDLRLYRPHSRMLLAFSRFWERLIYRSAEAIVAAPGYAKYFSEGLGIPLDRFCVSPLTVDTSLFFPRSLEDCRRSLGVGPGPVIVWMGNMVSHQGLKSLVSAAPLIRKAVPDVRVVLVGDGPERPACQRLVDDLGVSDLVQFTGNVPQSRVAEYIGAGNVCVAMFPGNRGRKGTISALKTISYLACARPVVTTEMDEMGEAIHEAGAGYMVPPDDPSALASKLINILCEPADTWHARCQNALTLAGKAGDWSTAAVRIATRLGDVVRAPANARQRSGSRIEEPR